MVGGSTGERMEIAVVTEDALYGSILPMSKPRKRVRTILSTSVPSHQDPQVYLAVLTGG